MPWNALQIFSLGHQWEILEFRHQWQTVEFRVERLIESSFHGPKQTYNLEYESSKMRRETSHQGSK